MHNHFRLNHADRVLDYDVRTARAGLNTVSGLPNSFLGLCPVALLATTLFLTSMPAFAAPIVVFSPDKTVKAEVSADGGTLHYSVYMDGQQILAPSEVGIKSDGLSFGKQCSLGTPSIRMVNETYPFFGGKSRAVNNARVVTLPVTTEGVQYSLDMHVANDGVAVRIRLPAKPGRKVEADLSTWKLPGDLTVWATPFDSGYEEHYRTNTLKELGGKNYGLPLTAKVGDKYVTISEAALKDYGDLAITAQEDGTFAGYLPNDRQGWTTDNEVVQPWRVTIVARDLTGLVNTTLVQNLNPPADPALLKADWIRPGRSTWQWMAIGAPQFDDQRQWVDWTKALGYEYYLVDEGWSSWKNAWPSLKSVCDYARTRGVKIWLWVHSNEVRDAAARKAYFQRAVEAGVVGVKVDFPPATNRWWSTWYHDTARDAASRHLLIDFHGATKPTGMERTYPNELTREAIRGHEYHITRYGRILEAQHDTILPFTRYVVGHGDYTPMVFDPKELQGNTLAHEIAQSVIFTSPFLCTGGHPRDYVYNSAKDVVSALPATWDETIVLPGSEPGKIAGMARRHGDQWFIGVLNGAERGSLEIKLDFLGRGSWKAIELGDVEGKPDVWNRQEENVDSQHVLRVQLSARGGFAAWIRKR